MNKDERIKELENAIENLPHWLDEAARILDLHASKTGNMSILSPKLRWYSEKINKLN